MPRDEIDVDRIAATAERLGLVGPDQRGAEDEGNADEIVIFVHIAGGLLADVGARKADIPRLRIVVMDEDNYEASDGEDGAWTETPTALEQWSRDEDSALVRAAGELPDDLRRELGLAGPD